ncbi:SDR family oxidoreductase [Pseudomonas sp. B21-012]|uniref:SDR family oxidoreductase n=1 Tax=Pseudomonas sp. B21-012 TaxID=2895472 RepID=UPI00215E7E89|nr:SDR family oxidoreductase [Pseudomonas sp. B21-012]UVM58022.1 SDR family oxidoreductase [Pseudomonas sp. B21-012]
MKIVVIGGTGLIGTQLCNNLRANGHKVLAASPKTGVDTLTGEGLEQALQGTDVVVDVANSPSFDDAAVLAFFQSSGRNLLAAEHKAEVRHHIALSVVGTERMQDSGYFRAKLAQEELIKASGRPYTILRATQFFEFMGAIAYSGADGNRVRLTNAALQPVASSDVALALANLAEQAPANRTLEIAGPDRLPLADFVRSYLQHNQDAREVIADPEATYFGAPIDDRSLTPDEGAILGSLHFQTWLKTTAVQR